MKVPPGAWLLLIPLVVAIIGAIGEISARREYQRLQEHLEFLEREQHLADFLRRDAERRAQIEAQYAATFQAETPMDPSSPILQPLLDARRKLEASEIDARIQAVLASKPAKKANPAQDPMNNAYEYFARVRHASALLQGIGQTAPAISTAMPSYYPTTWTNNTVSMTDAEIPF